ncbi:MAG: homoserine kinase [Planctomycetes bacterium]|nr:homoserine kinase [Planctomycetota bacterium]
MRPWTRVHAPATIGNLGPGFDTLGAAVRGAGDEVHARTVGPRGVRVLQVLGVGAAGIPLDPTRNTASVAAAAVLEVIGSPRGLELRVLKGLPPGSGLGSSAASAAAGAVAAARALGERLPAEVLVACATRGEQAASGAWFADNTAAAVCGGVVLVASHEPLRLVRLGVIPGLAVALATPRTPLETRTSRSVLPAEVPLADVVHNMARTAQLVAAFARRDPRLLRGALEDRVAEPARAPLVPGFYQVKEAALSSGALGASLSGAGPTVFALCMGVSAARRAAGAMRAAFALAGVESDERAAPLAASGARVLGP